MAAAVGLAKGGVPVWTLAGLWQSTVGQAGACAGVFQAFVLSGFGFIGGVVLTGSAAVAGLHFCKAYNDACGDCVGHLPGG